VLKEYRELIEQSDLERFHADFGEKNEGFLHVSDYILLTIQQSIPSDQSKQVIFQRPKQVKHPWTDEEHS